MVEITVLQLMDELEKTVVGAQLRWRKLRVLLEAQAAQQSVQSDLLPCGHPSDRLNIDYTSMNCWCMDCDAATHR